MNLFSVLPAPSQNVWDRDEERAKVAAAKPVSALFVTQSIALPYGMRKGWVPRTVEDFEDGGSFPEIQVAQFIPDKEFSGIDRTATQSGPVQFEKEKEEDPFGLDQFLKQAKRVSKRPKDD